MSVGPTSAVFPGVGRGVPIKRVFCKLVQLVCLIWYASTVPRTVAATSLMSRRISPISTAVVPYLGSASGADVSPRVSEVSTALVLYEPSRAVVSPIDLTLSAGIVAAQCRKIASAVLQVRTPYLPRIYSYVADVNPLVVILSIYLLWRGAKKALGDGASEGIAIHVPEGHLAPRDCGAKYPEISQSQEVPVSFFQGDIDVESFTKETQVAKLFAELKTELRKVNAFNDLKTFNRTDDVQLRVNFDGEGCFYRKKVGGKMVSVTFDLQRFLEDSKSNSPARIAFNKLKEEFKTTLIEKAKEEIAMSIDADGEKSVEINEKNYTYTTEMGNDRSAPKPLAAEYILKLKRAKESGERGVLEEAVGGSGSHLIVRYHKKNPDFQRLCDQVNQGLKSRRGKSLWTRFGRAKAEEDNSVKAFIRGQEREVCKNQILTDKQGVLSKLCELVKTLKDKKGINEIVCQVRTIPVASREDPKFKALIAKMEQISGLENLMMQVLSTSLILANPLFKVEEFQSRMAALGTEIEKELEEVTKLLSDSKLALESKITQSQEALALLQARVSSDDNRKKMVAKVSHAQLLRDQKDFLEIVKMDDLVTTIYDILSEDIDSLTKVEVSDSKKVQGILENSFNKVLNLAGSVSTAQKQQFLNMFIFAANSALRKRVGEDVIKVAVKAVVDANEGRLLEQTPGEDVFSLEKGFRLS